LLLVATLYPIGTIFMNTLVPLYIGKILGALGQGLQPMHYVPYVIGAAIAGLIANRIGHPALLKYQAQTMADLQTMALGTLLRRSVGFHNNNVGGKLVSDAIDYPNAFSNLTNACFLNLMPFFIILTSGVIVVFIESWMLGLVVATMAGFVILASILSSRRRAVTRIHRLAATKAVTSHLADTIVNVQTVKTFAREDVELMRHDVLNTKLSLLRQRDWHDASISGNKRMAVLLALQIAFVLVLIHLVQHNPALLATGIFAFSFSITLMNRLFEVNGMLRSIEDGFLQSAPLTEIILKTPEIQDKPRAAKLRTTKAAIAFNDVTFRYADAADNQAVFTNLQLTIAPGEKVGLVGPSGGGKSTFTRLLLRFDDINEGTITIDGQNIADVTQQSLRQSISYVPQEPLLFHRPIKENIAYGHPEASMATIMRAAKAAHAEEFIEQLPGGYDTVVGERGVKLSGGQRQRIAIARAILKDAPILVLDEATSALDSESEVFIQDALWKLMKHRTAIVIAHRLSTIQKMDRILVLEDGSITEQGTHQQLLKRKGTYAKLWAHQSGGFIEE